MQVKFSFDSKKGPDEAAVEDEHKKRLYDKYSAERADLNRTALEIGGRYDKAVFILGGGSFALSITFIEKIAPYPTFFGLAFLVVSWIFLLTSLLLSLFATSKSQGAIQRQIVLLDKQYKVLLYPDSPASDEADIENKYLDQVKSLDVWARWTLVLGLVCLCFFAVVNVMTKKDTANAPQTPTTEAHPTPNPTPAPTPKRKANSEQGSASPGNLYPANELAPTTAAIKK